MYSEIIKSKIVQGRLLTAILILVLSNLVGKTTFKKKILRI